MSEFVSKQLKLRKRRLHCDVTKISTFSTGIFTTKFDRGPLNWGKGLKLDGVVSDFAAVYSVSQKNYPPTTFVNFCQTAGYF